MPTDVPTFPPGLLALVPGAVEALDARETARAAALDAQAAYRAYSPEVLASRRDPDRTTAARDAVELKARELSRAEDTAWKDFSRLHERYAAVVNGHRREASFRSEVAEALPGLDRAAREAWTAFEEAFESREAAYRLLGSPAETQHYLHRLKHVDAQLSGRPHLEKVAGFVKGFPSEDAITAALAERAAQKAS